MRRVYCFAITLIFIHHLSAQNNLRLLDQSMVIQKYSVQINADIFTATTKIEIEFFNPRDKEIEGLYNFELQPGQVITSFQLDINGKYRDGTIEEKWKARTAYNTIVGKRVDPGLLQMDYPNHYRLNVYPVPAKAARKITFTVLQPMKQNKTDAEYNFSLNKNDSILNFSVNALVQNAGSSPVSNKGLLDGIRFDNTSSNYSAQINLSNYKVKQSLQFCIPLITNDPVYCTKQAVGKTFFALRFNPHIKEYNEIHPKNVLVYWDVSSSASNKNLQKEISFLEKYIAYNQIKKISIIPFNFSLVDTVVFDITKQPVHKISNYLRGLNYDGGTQLGKLDFSAFSSDVVLLFTDGINSYGKAFPAGGNVPVYCIHSSKTTNLIQIQQMIEASGGTDVDLNKLSFSDAIQKTSVTENLLMEVAPKNNKTIIEHTFPVKLKELYLLFGYLETESEVFQFKYGNNASINYTDSVIITKATSCSETFTERLPMLVKYKQMTNVYWEDLLEFGLKEKIVTGSTAYIVLEKAEDYIKYNIEPPADLKTECEKLNYVKQDTRFQRRQLKKITEMELLNNVIDEYNRRIKKWDKNTPLLENFSTSISSVNINQQATAENPVGISNSQTVLEGKVAGLSITGNALNEVVVTGYGVSVKKNLTSSVSVVRQKEIFPGAQSIEQILAGRVTGVNVTGNGLPGTNSSITIRGISSLGASNQPLFILDGIQVTGNVNNLINPSDIDNITVLKDASATALYGSRGANGVIIVNSKKGKQNYYYNRGPYKLENMEDVDYIVEMKNTPKNELLTKYYELRMQHKDEPGFYFDVAQYLFENGFENDAVFVLSNAAETARGVAAMQKGIAYTFENWKKFNKAVEIYEAVLSASPDDMSAYRNLAWAYYQNSQYQQAVDILYAAIIRDWGRAESTHLLFKSILLNEMNAIIAARKQQIDITKINNNFIKPLEEDLRIVIDDNMNALDNVTIKEPGGVSCNSFNHSSKSAGYFTAKSKNDYWQYWYYPKEYQVKKAVPGKYKIWVNYYGNYHSAHIPSFIRVTVFKNFGTVNQTVTVQNIIMDNQYGEIEMAEIKQ